MLLPDRGSIKARSPNASPGRLLPIKDGGPAPRSASYSLLPGSAPAPPAAALWERLQRQRPLKLAVALLMAMVVGANLAWVGTSAVAAWSRGKPATAAAAPLLQRLNSTTLSVRVSRVDGEGGRASQAHTYLVNASVLGSGAEGTSIQQQQVEAGEAAPSVAAGDDGSLDNQAFIAQLKGLGGMLTGTLQAVQPADGAATGSGAAGGHGGRSSTGVASTGSRRDPERLDAQLAQPTVIPAAAANAVGVEPAAARQTQLPAATLLPMLVSQKPAPAVVAAPPLPETASEAQPKATNLWLGKTASGSAPAAASGTSSLPSPSPPPGPHRAVLAPPEVAPRSADACAQALGSPKVALMFLTKGDLFHAPTWKLWFESGGVKLGRAGPGRHQGRLEKGSSIPGSSAHHQVTLQSRMWCSRPALTAPSPPPPGLQRWACCQPPGRGPRCVESSQG